MYLGRNDPGRRTDGRRASHQVSILHKLVLTRVFKKLDRFAIDNFNFFPGNTSSDKSIQKLERLDIQIMRDTEKVSNKY